MAPTKKQKETKENIVLTDRCPIPEFTIVLKNKMKPSERLEVRGSKELYEVARRCFDADDIEWKESLLVIALNSGPKVLGFFKVSSGGMTHVLADPRVIFQFALLSNASSIVLCHNHPSGNLKPSRDDVEVTNKLKMAGQLLDIRLIEHLILSPENGYYYSFSDEGML